MSDTNKPESSPPQWPQAPPVRLAAMHSLYELQASLASESNLNAALDKIIATAIAFAEADRGFIQLVGDDGHLEVASSRGFDAGSAAASHVRHDASAAISDVVWRSHHRVVVEDVETHPALAGTEDREILIADGARAVQSTPMLTRRGELVGILTTWFRQPHRPTGEQLRLIDMLAWIAADFVKRYKTERTLRESEARQRFLLKLSDAIRPLADANQIQMEACRLLGEHLDVDRAYWAEISEAEHSIRVYQNYLRGDSPSLAGEFILEEYGWVVLRLRRGETVVVDDTDASALPSGEDRAAMDAITIRSLVAIPLIKSDSLVGALCVTEPRPRAWTASDVELVRETGERLWATIQRARAEMILRESEERLVLVFDSLPVAVGMLNLEGHIVLSNKEMDRYLSHRTTPSTDDPLADRIRMWKPDGRRLASEEFPGARALRGETVLPGIELLYGLDEIRQIWVRVAAVPRRDNDGRITGAIIVISDIDNIKRAEMALSESEERFRGFAEASADVLWIADAETRHLDYLSPAFERIWGVEREVAKRSPDGRAISVHPDDLASFHSIFPRVLEGETVVMEYRLIRPADRIVRWIRDTGFPVRAKNGTITHVAGIAQDITDVKQAEFERETFVDAAAHDLKTPLTALRGQAQLLLRRARRGKLTDATMLESRLLQIDNAGARMVAAIDEMLDAGHIRAERPLELRPGSVDLVELVSNAVAGITSSKRRHSVRIETDESTLVGVWDGARLGRVIDNLIGNAVKYSPDGGDVIVEIDRERDESGADWAVVRVCDRGIGIPEVDMPLLFQRFQRAGNAMGFRGTGIGLAGARQIAEQHGGTLTVESEEGQGSTFTMRLPL